MCVICSKVVRLLLQVSQLIYDNTRPEYGDSHVAFDGLHSDSPDEIPMVARQPADSQSEEPSDYGEDHEHDRGKLDLLHHLISKSPFQYPYTVVIQITYHRS